MSDTIECDACGEEKPAEGHEMVVIDSTYVDGMLVSEDREPVCADCIYDAEESQVERALDARAWAQYDKWEARHSSACEGLRPTSKE